MIENSGAEFLTIHGRTVKQKYSGGINLDIIKQVKNLIEIPVVGNGDVIDYESYRKMKETTGCDAVMIGRAAMSDPSIFNRIWKRHNKNNSPFVGGG